MVSFSSNSGWISNLMSNEPGITLLFEDGIISQFFIPSISKINPLKSMGDRGDVVNISWGG